MPIAVGSLDFDTEETDVNAVSLTYTLIAIVGCFIPGLPSQSALQKLIKILCLCSCSPAFSPSLGVKVACQDLPLAREKMLQVSHLLCLASVMTWWCLTLMR